tara:strand:+ start:194 stop:622 length:429 start_codon:yes stop_codon:yes gene_type:complete
MTSLRHVGIVVSNIESSLTFYRDLLGLQYSKINREEGTFLDGLLNMSYAKIQTIKLASKNDSVSIELLCFEEPLPSLSTPLNAIGPTHIALNVPNLDRLYIRLKNADVPFNNPPQISPSGSAKVAFCQDPDGTFIELVEVLK